MHILAVAQAEAVACALLPIPNRDTRPRGGFAETCSVSPQNLNSPRRLTVVVLRVVVSLAWLLPSASSVLKPVS